MTDVSVAIAIKKKNRTNMAAKGKIISDWLKTHMYSV